jgi:hypothetical protein
MMRLDPTALLPSLAGLEEPDCPACATGWHTRCCQPDLAEDGDGELVERCCDGHLYPEADLSLRERLDAIYAAAEGDR